MCSINQLLLWPTRRKIVNIKNYKTNSYIHNTKGDVALTNISRETNYFHDFVQNTKLVKLLKTENLIKNVAELCVG